ncbi:MAG: cytochrome C oxidase subunit IV family protein [Acidimicrobiales bacterium]
MSTETTEEAHREGHEPDATHDATHDHPSDGKYIQIALILAALTAAEVATFYVEDSLGSLLVPILLSMMVVKFFIVAAWFMHLRFDSNLFTRLFLSGLLLATGVYLIFLLTFEFF